MKVRSVGGISLVATMGLLLLMSLACGQPGFNAPAEDEGATRPERQQAADLLKRAQELIAARRFEEAEQCLQQAQAIDPSYPAVCSNLGYLYDAWRAQIRDTATPEQIIALRTKALEAYGQLVSLWPENSYGRARLRALFYEGYFPRVIRPADMAFSGVSFVNDEVRVDDKRWRLAYTNSLLYPEQMKPEGGNRASGPAKIPLPVTGERAYAEFNRAAYGFLMPPESDRFFLTFCLLWPSETLSAGRNYQPLATRLLHLLLRFHVYGRHYLGRPPNEGVTPVVTGYLCLLGPAGAETYKNALYFYNIETPRSGIEWARQAAHEYGHLVLPEIGRFGQPEPFASGELGERLFLQYLAEEAGAFAGEPWPSLAAQKAVAALWPEGEFALAEYIEKICRPSLDYWFAAGPEAGLITAREGLGAEAMQYLIGFLLWTQAAFGPETLRAVLARASSTQPIDYLTSFRQVMAEQAQKGRLVMDAGALDVKASRLKEPPVEGALRRRNVVLTPGDSAAFIVYLPAGVWRLAIQPVAPGLTVVFDEKGPLPLDQSGAVSLGALPADGWYRLRVQLTAGGEPVQLQQLQWQLAPQGGA